MQAAREAESADASIGNVTGSNSVNVFMGQGLPWLVAIWHLQKGTEYRVEPGALGFSVVVYTGCALVCITMLPFGETFAVAARGTNDFKVYLRLYHASPLDCVRCPQPTVRGHHSVYKLSLCVCLSV